jgi:hypothetical protein
MSRSTELLAAAAAELEAGRDPFAGSFLADHDVTADECIALSGQLGLAAQILVVLSSPSYRRIKGMLLADVLAQTLNTKETK